MEFDPLMKGISEGRIYEVLTTMKKTWKKWSLELNKDSNLFLRFDKKGLLTAEVNGSFIHIQKNPTDHKLLITKKIGQLPSPEDLWEICLNFIMASKLDYTFVVENTKFVFKDLQWYKKTTFYDVYLELYKTKWKDIPRNVITESVDRVLSNFKRPAGEYFMYFEPLIQQIEEGRIYDVLTTMKTNWGKWTPPLDEGMVNIDEHGHIRAQVLHGHIIVKYENETYFFEKKNTEPKPFHFWGLCLHYMMLSNVTFKFKINGKDAYIMENQLYLQLRNPMTDLKEPISKLDWKGIQLRLEQLQDLNTDYDEIAPKSYFQQKSRPEKETENRPNRHQPRMMNAPEGLAASRASPEETQDL